ncbi:MAG: hypothetical protein IPN66_04745 [Candidatus Competibacteraceae bacterium]|nr:hypothetical protein [Candidatus Competibacteraceae bacterium]MBK8964131.1 hypothetical protein [Candidatus Competibacteraceae bacterium]
MTRIDPNQIQALISQNFDSARATGQLGGRAVQMGQAQPPRVQASASGFINKIKSLYDRGIREQRAEEGITRGIKNLDKALGKLFNEANKDNIDLANVLRRLEALPDSAKSATSRGVKFDELMKARLMKMDKSKLIKINNTAALAMNEFVSNRDRFIKLPVSYFERKHIKQQFEIKNYFVDELATHHLAARKASFSSVTPEVETDEDRRANFDKALDGLLGALAPDTENRIGPNFDHYLKKFSTQSEAMNRFNKLDLKFIEGELKAKAEKLNPDQLEKLMAGAEIAIRDLAEKNSGLNEKLSEKKESPEAVRRKLNAINQHLEIAKLLQGILSKESEMRPSPEKIFNAVLDALGIPDHSQPKTPLAHSVARGPEEDLPSRSAKEPSNTVLDTSQQPTQPEKTAKAPRNPPTPSADTTV